jgi:DNA-binding CsgD family transcriptional regulator
MIQLTKKTGVLTQCNDLCRNFGLTQREAEVCALVIQGYSDKEVSKKLTIGFPTVRTHLSHVFTKIGVTSRSE